jgi:hypothetical protein
MELLWGKRKGYRRMLRKKYSSMENIREAVVMRGVRRRRTGGV